MMNAMSSKRFAQGWKRRSTIGAVLVAASAWLSGSAWAAAASDLTVTLVETQPEPEVSLAANILYRIRIENSSINTVNQVVFTGSTDVGAYSAFVNIGTANPNCAAPSSPVDLNVHSVTCQVGQLKSGAFVEFYLFFQTPTSGASITFNGHTDFSEGASSGQKPAHFTKDLPEKTVALITGDSANKKVKTVLTSAGGTFSTGVNGGVNSNNPWSTGVVVPSTGLITKNQINLSTFGTANPTDPPVSFACSVANPGYYCFGLQSTIDVLKVIDSSKLVLPDGTSVLTITLRQDASSLAVMNPIPKIGDIRIFYNPNPPQNSNDVGTEVLDCGVNPPPTPSENVPCMHLRDPSNLKGKKGYYEWTIYAKDNGNFMW
jgi:hypothetical protein